MSESINLHVEALPSRVSHKKLRLFGYGACALAGTLWGTGFYFGRLALDEMGVEPMVLYRFLFACLGMLPVILVHGCRYGFRMRLNAGEIRLLLIASGLGIPVQFLMQFHGLAITTVSHAALMVGAMPVLLAASAALFTGERLDRLGWILLFFSTLGAALVTLGGGHAASGHGGPSLAGDMLILSSLVTSLAWILLSKKLMEEHTPLAVSVYTIFSGTAMLALVVAAESGFAALTHRAFEPMPFAHVSLRAWLALSASGVLCTATTTLLWNWGLHHVPASRAGVFLNIEPALGSVLGVELLGEHLGPFAGIGGLLILGAAIALTARVGAAHPEIVPKEISQ